MKKTAFVTGAGSGIGRATATAFAQAGHAVALIDRAADAGQSAADELAAAGHDALFIACDVTDDAAVEQAVAQTMQRFGRLDAAFNAAGIDGEQGKLTADISPENWQRVLAVNLTGTWSCMRHQLPAMLKSGGGSIVNCSSVAGLVGAFGFAAYVASKHGIVGLTKSAALEYVRQGVRVNAVCPGTIDTPMNAGLDRALLQQLLAAAPAGRLGLPNEVAGTVLWLCSEAGGFVNGQAIAIDGGWTTQ
jgi:NAD(P)-dependent dehydrogenase (short-subunit alcohol dehydrogenase family)